MEEEQKKEVQPQHKAGVHTFEDDMSKALDTTDAIVVQEMLVEGREREALEKEAALKKKQKGWYSAGAIVLIVFTLGAIGYTLYHYTHLTVPAEQTASVGVFPSTAVVVAQTTDIRTVVKNMESDTTLEQGKPTLIPLVRDGQSLTLLSPDELFSFFEAKATEPFLSSFNLVRLGVMSTGTENIPFVIGSIPDVDIAAKELLIAEPSLLQLLYKPLAIDISTIKEEVGAKFSGDYMYNIPVRLFHYEKQDGTSGLFFYAHVSENIVVFTTSPEVLKAIYDSLIQQQS